MLGTSEVVPRAGTLEVLRAAIPYEERVLVRGASGWFGRTAVALLWHLHGPEWVQTHLLATASQARVIRVLGCGELTLLADDHDAIARFEPTTVANCAFLTRDRVAEMGIAPYIAATDRLIDELVAIVALPSVRRAVTLSSGAAVRSPAFPDDPTINPYGVQKAREASALLRTAQRHGVGAQVCRVWAVSGPHVQHPRNYALPGFILDALREGAVQVRSPYPVVRSYVPAEDALTLALWASGHGSGTFDTGGTPREIGEVAEVVGAVLGVPVNRPRFDPGQSANEYYSLSIEWDRLMAEVGLAQSSLDDQVNATARGLRSWRGE